MVDVELGGSAMVVVLGVDIGARDDYRQARALIVDKIVSWKDSTSALRTI